MNENPRRSRQRLNGDNRVSVERAQSRFITPSIKKKFAATWLLVMVVQNAWAGPNARCAAESRMHAEPLLRMFIGGDDDRMAIDDDVKALRTIKNPAGNGLLDVEEIWGVVYKWNYRMHFIYRHDGGGCVLVGQEILH